MFRGKFAFLKVVVAFWVALVCIPALAEEVLISSSISDFPTMDIDSEEYTPPDWLTCEEVKVASTAPSWTMNCLMEPEVAAGDAEVIVFANEHLNFLEWVNDRVNEALSDGTLESMIKAAQAKRQLLERMNEIPGRGKFPSTALLYAITELPVALNGTELVYVPHFTLVVRFDKGDVVLDGALPDVISWACFPGHIYGIQSPWRSGQWLKVFDYRNDPATSARECAANG